MWCEQTLSFFGQSGHAPHDGAVLVLVLGLSGRHLDERLLQRVHSAQEPLDALNLARSPAIRVHTFSHSDSIIFTNPRQYQNYINERFEVLDG